MNTVNYLPNDIMQMIMNVRREEMKNDKYKKNYNNFVKSFNKAVDIYCCTDLFECEDRIIHSFGEDILNKYREQVNSVKDLREFMDNEGIGIIECLVDEPENEINMWYD